PAGREHELDGLRVVVLRGTGKLAAIVLRQAPGKVGTARQEVLEDRFVAELAGSRQLQLLGASLHEEAVYILMFKLAGDPVGGVVPAQGPNVDRAAAPRVLLWEVLLGDAHPEAFRSGVEVLSNELEVAQRRGHEDVGPAAASDQETRHLLAVAQHVLRRS